MADTTPLDDTTLQLLTEAPSKDKRTLAVELVAARAALRALILSGDSMLTILQRANWAGFDLEGGPAETEYEKLLEKTVMGLLHDAAWHRQYHDGCIESLADALSDATGGAVPKEDHEKRDERRAAVGAVPWVVSLSASHACLPTP